MKPLGVQALIDTLAHVQHKIAVYEELRSFLQQYLPDDCGDDEQLVMDVPSNLIPIVGEKAIEETIHEIEDKLEEAHDLLKKYNQAKISLPKGSK